MTPIAEGFLNLLIVDLVLCAIAVSIAAFTRQVPTGAKPALWLAFPLAVVAAAHNPEALLPRAVQAVCMYVVLVCGLLVTLGYLMPRRLPKLAAWSRGLGAKADDLDRLLPAIIGCVFVALYLAGFGSGATTAQRELAETPVTWYLTTATAIVGLTCAMAVVAAALQRRDDARRLTE